MPPLLAAHYEVVAALLVGKGSDTTDIVGGAKQGTEADGRAAADAPLLAEDFAVIEALLARHPHVPRAGFTLQNYTEAASWVASRAFGVDSVHGDRRSLHCKTVFSVQAAFDTCKQRRVWRLMPSVSQACTAGDNQHENAKH